MAGFFDGPFDHLVAMPVLVDYVESHLGDDLVIVSPDAGRVKVAERYANALHADPLEFVNLVTVDLGWTRQRDAIPAAIRWLKPQWDRLPAGGPHPRIITLIKPHYEIDREELNRLADRGVLPDEHAERVVETVVQELRETGFNVEAITKSPIRGGGRSSRGNAEWLALITPTDAQRVAVSA